MTEIIKSDWLWGTGYEPTPGLISCSALGTFVSANATEQQKEMLALSTTSAKLELLAKSISSTK